MSLLRVEDLKVYYPLRASLFAPKKFVKALDGVSFEIGGGEIVGLVGESGCGKSTLGRALVRLESPHSGKIVLNDIDIANVKGKASQKLRKDFQMIFQDPYGSLNPRLTIFNAIDEVLALHTMLDKAARRARAAQLLEDVGLGADSLDRYPHQFSGGQRQRIGIARALAAGPKLIVADEPVSALDVSVQASIINLLQDICEKTGTSFLFIAHDLAVVEHIASKIMVMYLGRIVESGPAREITQHPLHPYTKALLSAVPDVGTPAGSRIILAGDVPSPVNPPSGCAFHPRCPLADDHCKQELPLLCEITPGHQCACFHAGE